MGALPFPIEQGQHIAIVGDTGTGKTTLAAALLELAPQIGEYVVAFRYRPEPRGGPAWPGYQRTTRAAVAMEGTRHKRVILEPKRDHISRLREFALALHGISRQGGWTVVIDDLLNIQRLGPPIHSRTDSLIDDLLISGRKMGITVITAQQLPVDSTKYAIGESRLTISFMLGRHYAKTISEKTSDEMGEATQRLGEHDVAMFWRPTHEVWIGRLDLSAVEGPRFVGDYPLASAARRGAALAPGAR